MSKKYRCTDAMCGALDCKTCYPFQDEAYRKWFLRNMDDRREEPEEKEEIKDET